MPEREFEIPPGEPEKNAGSMKKEKTWAEMAKRVERTKDALDLEIDERIKETVIALNLLEVNTTASCEGHLDGGLAYPWVDVKSRGVIILKQQLKSFEGKPGHEAKVEEVMAKITARNLEERRKLIALLDEFYRERKTAFAKRLTTEGMAMGWTRLESAGAELQEIEEPDVKRQRLAEYQQEMREFTDFLKQKYFEE